MSKNKKPLKVTRKFIEEVTKNLRQRMNLSHYEISLFYVDNDDDFGSAIRIDTDTTYLRASLYIYPTAITGTREEFVEYMKHELTHIILQPLVDIAEEHASTKRIEKPLENVVEHVRRLICNG